MGRIKINEIYSNLLYQVPKEFFVNPNYEKLSSNAILLYSILRDRMELSRKNNWVNKQGEIYLIFPREEICKLMRLSNKTITNTFKELINHKLIEEVRQGLNKPNLIYICHLELQSIENTLTCKNYMSGSENFTGQNMKNLHTINTNKNNTNLNQLTTTTEPEKMENKNIVVKTKEKIKETIGTDINYEVVCNLINTKGIKKIEHALNTWEQYNHLEKRNIVGFFIRLVCQGWVNQSSTPIQNNTQKKVKFETHQYDDDFYDAFYEHNIINAENGGGEENAE
jgi:hypothetical protein